MPDGPAADTVLLSLDGFEGPLDLLLDLARGQKVDLARVSVVALADQYIAAVQAMDVEGRRPPPLERAADWLVMAAWLTWLKSRLLLPRGSAEADGAGAAARLLADRLGELQRIRALADWLGARPQAGRDTWTPAPAAEPFAADAVRSDVAGLLHAYLGHLRMVRGRRGRAAREAWRPVPLGLWTVAQAVERLRRTMGAALEGGPLDLFLPPPPEDWPDPRLWRRAAVASTLVGALELARDERADLRQDAPFGEVRVVPVRHGSLEGRPDGEA